MSLIEMVARSTKNLYKTKIRNSIIHFRNVGATSIQSQMKHYAVNIVSNVLNTTDDRYFESKIKPLLFSKFDISICYKQYLEIYKPALFIAIQYHV